LETSSSSVSPSALGAFVAGVEVASGWTLAAAGLIIVLKIYLKNVIFS
jgi:hypothetical protein